MPERRSLFAASPRSSLRARGSLPRTATTPHESDWVKLKEDLALFKKSNLALEEKYAKLETKYAALDAKFRREMSKSAQDLEAAPTTPAKGARGSGACNTPAFGGPSSPPASPLSPVMPAEGESQIFRSPPTFSKENSSPASEKQPKAATKRAACRWPPTSNLHEATAARPLQPIQPQVRVRTGYPEEYRVGEQATIGVAPWPHPAPPRPFFVVNPAIRGHI